MASTGPVRCQGCGQGFREEALFIEDLFFHSGCFKCAGCSKRFAEGDYAYTVDEKIVCGTCFNAKYLPPCFGCKKKIEKETIHLLGNEYHRDCTPKCCRCQKSPGDIRYAMIDGKMCCTECVWMTIQTEEKTIENANAKELEQVNSISSE